MNLEYTKRDSRHQVLESIKLSGPQTTDELSNTLALSLMAIRQHLIALERDGFVHHRPEKRGVGRPSFVYSLTDHGDALFPRNYAQLTNELLEIIRELDGEAGIERIFKHRNARLVAAYRKRMLDKDLKGRVKELALIRSEEGFMADLECLDEDAFVLRELNCPVFQVAGQCSQVCFYEQELFGQVLEGVKVHRETHILSGDQKCTYLIRRI